MPASVTVMPDTFLYFAFGSNLLTERIHINNPSATFVDVARLDGYKLEFNHFCKRWKGASATVNPINFDKSDARNETEGLAGRNDSAMDHVWGVLWRLNQSDMPHLDEQEGVQLDSAGEHVGVYKPLLVDVLLRSTGETVQARAYRIIRPLERDRRPSKVYLDVICRGAEEHDLPQDYQKFLQSIEHNGYDEEVDIKLNLTQKHTHTCKKTPTL